MCKRKGYFYDHWSKLETDIVDELTYNRARKTPLGVVCCCCPRCWCRRKCVIPAYVMAIGLGISALLLLIGFCIFIVRPHLATGHYRPTTCRTVSSKVEEHRMITCTCGGAKASCSALYPCLTIIVNYKRHDGIDVQTQIYSDEHAGPCSYNPPCSRDVSKNTQAVKKYQETYGKKYSSVKCLYDPRDGSEHVLQTRTDSGFIRPFWLWPTVVIGVCVFFFFVTLCTCGWKYHLYKYPPTYIREIAARLEAQRVERLKHYSPSVRRRLVEECSHLPEEEDDDPSKRVFNPPPIIEVMEDDPEAMKSYVSSTV